jgi:MYXO-CTERM domain-containing protein
MYLPYNVDIVSTRPTAGRYSMMMIGGTATLVGSGGGVVGIAPLDCGNSNESNVGFAFSASLVQSNRTSQASADRALREIALTAAHEAGHAYGLEHVNNTADIMYPSVSQGQATFAGSAAIAQPPKQCGSGTTQNTGGTLGNNVGLRSGPAPDLGLPPQGDLGKPADMKGAAADLSTAPTGDMATALTGDLAGAAGSDLGTPGGSDPPPGGGCSCDVSSQRGSLPAPLAMLALVFIGGLARRRRIL